MSNHIHPYLDSINSILISTASKTLDPENFSSQEILNKLKLNLLDAYASIIQGQIEDENKEQNMQAIQNITNQAIFYLDSLAKENQANAAFNDRQIFRMAAELYSDILEIYMDVPQMR